MIVAQFALPVARLACQERVVLEITCRSPSPRLWALFVHRIVLFRCVVYSFAHLVSDATQHASLQAVVFVFKDWRRLPAAVVRSLFVHRVAPALGIVRPSCHVALATL